MMRRILLPRWGTSLALPLLTLWACRGPGARAATPASPEASPSPVSAGDAVAEVEGLPITRGELDQRVENRLARRPPGEHETRPQGPGGPARDQLLAEEGKPPG